MIQGYPRNKLVIQTVFAPQLPLKTIGSFMEDYFMSYVLVAPCGRSKNARGKPFNAQGLRHHRKNCEDCMRVADRVDEQEGEQGVVEGVFSMLDTSDESDGVWHALRDELDGW